MRPPGAGMAGQRWASRRAGAGSEHLPARAALQARAHGPPQKFKRCLHRVRAHRGQPPDGVVAQVRLADQLRCGLGLRRDARDARRGIRAGIGDLLGLERRYY